MITFLRHQPREGASYRERGMTLIEVVIAIAIMGVIVGAVYEFLLFANRETRAADTKEEIVEEVNLFFLRVSQDIRNAIEIPTPPPPPSTTLTLHLPDKDNENEITIITYEWDSSSYSIRRKVEKNVTPTPTPTVTPTPTPTPTSTPPPMVKNVTYANFSKPANNKIKIEVKVEIETLVAGRGQSEPFSQTFSTVVTCRN